MDRLAELIVSMHKQNLNPPSTHIRLAEVISMSPIRLRWGEGIIIDNDKLIIPQIYTSGCDASYTAGHSMEVDIKLKIKLNIGDEVTVAPDEHLKRWYIINKVGD